MTERKPSDEELWRAMADGDEEAFVTLYRRWQAPIHRFAVQMSGSRAVAEDVTQEVFIALIRDPSGYRPSRGSFGAYLYGIARHLLLRALERERASGAGIPACRPGDFELTGKDACPTADGPHEELLRNQQVERLWKAILGLPVHYREALVLCELHEMNYAEAAKLLGCGLGTVRSRLHRARAMLTERLRSARFEAGRAVSGIEPNGCAV